MRWIVGTSLLVVGCTAELAEEGSSGPESGESTASSADPTGQGDRGTSTTGPSEGTTTAGGPSTSSSEGADSDSGPGIYLDVGSIPDMPSGTGCQQGVDIVFVMDVSTTMATFIQILADEILVVDAALAKLDLPEPPHYGLAVFVDDALLVNGGAPYLDAMTLRDEFIMWSNFTATNQQVGGGNSNSTWTENSLDGLYFAADEFEWRPAESTIRIVIHTTDDTFWDGPTVGNGVMIQHGYAETVGVLQTEEVRVYAFTDDIGGSCSCEDVTPGWSAPYMGMVPIPDATDGSNFDIGLVLSGAVSLADAINSAVEESICDPYTPQG